MLFALLAVSDPPSFTAKEITIPGPRPSTTIAKGFTKEGLALIETFAPDARYLLQQDGTLVELKPPADFRPQAVTVGQEGYIQMVGVQDRRQVIRLIDGQWKPMIPPQFSGGDSCFTSGDMSLITAKKTASDPFQSFYGKPGNMRNLAKTIGQDLRGIGLAEDGRVITFQPTSLGGRFQIWTGKSAKLIGEASLKDLTWRVNLPELEIIAQRMIKNPEDASPTLLLRNGVARTLWSPDGQVLYNVQASGTGSYIGESERPGAGRAIWLNAEGSHFVDDIVVNRGDLRIAGFQDSFRGVHAISRDGRFIASGPARLREGGSAYKLYLLTPRT